jgi:hypothetical protein
MRRTLITLVGTFGLVGALGTAGGLAAPSATAQGCAEITDIGLNGDYSYVPTPDNNYNLYFDKTGNATDFCIEYIGDTAYVEMVDSGDGRCLAVNSTAVDVDEDSAAACGAQDSWDQWEPIFIGLGEDDIWAFKNKYNGQCLYDDKQRPAIYAACGKDATDGFLQFYWEPADGGV